MAQQQQAEPAPPHEGSAEHDTSSPPEQTLNHTWSHEPQVTVPSDIETLRFYSAWSECPESPDLTLRVGSNSHVGGGLSTRNSVLVFDVKTNTFTISLEANGQEIKLQNVTAYTATHPPVPCDVWDLHVGATVIVLGRPMHLRNADFATANWNHHHACRLKQLKTELLDNLQKYRPRAHQPAVTHDRGTKATGGLSLRSTVIQLNQMVQDLKQWRPVKAQQLASRIQISL